MGREIDKKILPEFFESVRSKRKTLLGWDNYCSNCGARMDGGGQ